MIPDHAHLPVDEARTAAVDEGRYGTQPYSIPLRRGSMELGFYKPTGVDTQSPHDQDEVYIVQQGTAVFVVEGVRYDVATGDALFVAAGEEHRFIEFSEDFETWVVFYGPTGGEADPMRLISSTRLDQ